MHWFEERTRLYKHFATELLRKYLCSTDNFQSWFAWAALCSFRLYSFLFLPCVCRVVQVTLYYNTIDFWKTPGRSVSWARMIWWTQFSYQLSASLLRTRHMLTPSKWTYLKLLLGDHFNTFIPQAHVKKALVQCTSFGIDAMSGWKSDVDISLWLECWMQGNISLVHWECLMFKRKSFIEPSNAQK